MHKIDKILIGTHNEGKFKEISDLLPLNVKKLSPKDLDIDSPKEDGKTFIENSELKANFFCNKSKLITISDDSGLEIDSLNGQPGIFSSRWAKQFGSFDNAMVEILKKIEVLKKGTAAPYDLQCVFIVCVSLHLATRFYVLGNSLRLSVCVRGCTIIGHIR